MTATPDREHRVHPQDRPAERAPGDGLRAEAAADLEGRAVEAKLGVERDDEDERDRGRHRRERDELGASVAADGAETCLEAERSGRARRNDPDEPERRRYVLGLGEVRERPIAGERDEVRRHRRDDERAEERDDPHRGAALAVVVALGVAPRAEREQRAEREADERCDQAGHRARA